MQQMQYIAIGDPASPSFSFVGDDILSTSGDFSVDMISAELCTDVMETEVSYDDADGRLRALPWATPVYFYRGETLEGKLYSVSVTRTGRTAYKISTTSAIGIMDHETFYGNMYTGETFKSVVEQVIGTNALQPFDGTYNTLKLTDANLSTFLAGYVMGLYDNQAKLIISGVDPIRYGGAFLSATMSSKLSTKFKINGFSNQSYDNYINATSSSPQTAFLSTLCGAVAAADAAEKIKKHQYGMYMQMTRESINVPFPEFGEVIFVYGQTEISLGTPASADEAIYEIEVDPGAGTVVINGVTHSIAFDSTVSNDPCALHVYGGGVGLYDAGFLQNIGASAVAHNVKLEIYNYTISTPEGQPQADYTIVQNIFTEEICAYDNVSRVLRKRIAGCSLSGVALEPYNAAAYGASVIFYNRTDFQLDVLGRLSYADGIDTLPIHGWLPICSKREALQQLLFVTGIIMIKDENGSILFTAPSSLNAGDIDDNAIYDEGSEDQPEHINSVNLTEHAYGLNSYSEYETIYENDAGSSSDYYIAQYVKSPAQHHDDWITTGLLYCAHANCNAAVVTGGGRLEGRPYLHTKKILQRDIASYPDAHGTSVSDATLVTLLNSETVLDRLAAYYGSAQKVRVGVAMNGERCGLKYSLKTAFGEVFSGFLVRVNKAITSVVRGACEFIRGYTPPPIGGYENYVILTGNGTWTVPASVFEKESPRIRVVLIGGGKGGDGGFAGESGVQPERGEGAQPAKGGAAGASGIGGNIFEITIESPSESYDYSCGQGGSGGGTSISHAVNSPGSVGGDTTFSGGGSVYSSASGTPNENGVTNIFTGDRYAWRLIRAYQETVDKLSDGGDGGAQSTESGGIDYKWPGRCEQWIMNRTYQLWYGGDAGEGIIDGGYTPASGGGGGGAGYGQNGSNGGAAYRSGDIVHSGNGGKGGDATEIPPKATDYNAAYYGYGGLGGGGGGGGGAGGWVWAGQPSVAGTGGAGGYGGRGGDGGDGCVLIYY